MSNLTSEDIEDVVRFFSERERLYSLMPSPKNAAKLGRLRSPNVLSDFFLASEEKHDIEPGDYEHE